METMWLFLQHISSNPLWTLGSFVVAIVGLILFAIFYRRSQKTKKPTFVIRSSNLVADFSSKLTKLQILYNSKEIENLTVSKIAFWNDGAQTIDSRDVAEADPLRIVLKEGYNILDVSLIYTKNPANRFCVVPLEKGSSVKISFDYLDKNEGGVIQLIHTGKSSSDIEISGIVKGVGNPKPRHIPSLIMDKILPTPKSSKLRVLKARRIIGIASFVAAIAMLVAVVLETELFTRIFGFILAVFYGYLGYTFLRRRIPRGFEIVEKEI